MIIKGSSRGGNSADVGRLAVHLLDGENETVDVAEIRGSCSPDLLGALNDFRAVTLASRCRKSVYHASLSLHRDETGLLTSGQWLNAVDVLEEELGLTGHPRAVVVHIKRGRRHLHVVWQRVDAAKLTAVSDGQNYAAHERAARRIEHLYGLRPVVGVHSRPSGTPRPVAQATHEDWQASERTGISVAEVAVAIQAAWAESKNGALFKAELERRGLSLATGRRGILVVDAVGTPHSISRRLGVKAGAVRERLADIDPESLPKVVEVVRTNGKRERGGTMSGMKAKGTPEATDWDALADYWATGGFASVKRWDCVVVDLFGTTMRDYGDRMEIDGEPVSDDQIAAMVAAAKARGWQGIEFWGSEDFQLRARAEAIRQGFPPESSALAMDGYIPRETPPKPEPSEVPEHMRRRLGFDGVKADAVEDREAAPGPAA